MMIDTKVGASNPRTAYMSGGAPTLAGRRVPAPVRHSAVVKESVIFPPISGGDRAFMEHIKRYILAHSRWIYGGATNRL
ncbi:hypothetical protein EVAR_70270_1 [Eumeta japonica]|uniref:Uncharacterized protein n=1 Tax=Eumeta variegata TaxID=151549 RepID=A0A4C2A5R5_EUMVA|nr:hypothetical protein EVAR_70270_1 [Eumeta japonica]